jgi:hypothetical protein
VTDSITVAKGFHKNNPAVYVSKANTKMTTVVNSVAKGFREIKVAELQSPSTSQEERQTVQKKDAINLLAENIVEKILIIPGNLNIVLNQPQT